MESDEFALEVAQAGIYPDGHWDVSTELPGMRKCVLASGWRCQEVAVVKT